MNILLIPNLGKKNAYECTCEVIKKLTNYGCSCWMFEERLADFVGQPVQMMTPQQSMDLIISIGGDGTIIHSAHHALQLDCPVLGINAGRLGFLTEIEYNDLDRLEDVVQGRYTIQPRMMLHATVIKTGQPVGIFGAQRCCADHRAAGKNGGHRCGDEEWIFKQLSGGWPLSLLRRPDRPPTR